MNKKTRLLCIVITFAMFFCSFNALAQTAAEKKKEMQQKINKAEKEYEAAEDKKLYYDSLADELDDDIAYYNGIIRSLDSEIADCNTRIGAAEEKLKIKQNSFEDRLRALQENGSLTYLDVIFGAKSFSDFLLRLTLVGDIVRHDKNMINEIAEIKSGIEAERAEIETKRTKQDEARDVVLAQQEQYELLSNKQNKLMADLKADQAAYKKEYEKAVRQMQEEEARSRSAVSSSVKYTPKGGKMHWPLAVSAQLTCPFGYRTDPAPSNHTGIDLAAGGIHGKSILAAESGTVTRVVNGSYGYGKYLIINHGDGSSTLYAHASKIYVTQGQKVQRGEAIAAVGNTGWSTGPHLHFEVIINGKKVNPVPYIY